MQNNDSSSVQFTFHSPVSLPPHGLCKSRQFCLNVCKISFQKALKAKFVAHRKMNGFLIFASSKAGIKEDFTHSNIILFNLCGTISGVNSKISKGG